MAATAVALVACGSSFKSATGPYATPAATPPVRVINSACSKVTSPAPGDLAFARNAITRQGTQLQRVSDDLNNSVPGGDLPKDTGLARQNAQALADALATSTLCQPLRDDLLKLATALAQADAAMTTAAQSGGDVAGALQKAEAADHDLDAAVKAAGG